MIFRNTSISFPFLYEIIHICFSYHNQAGEKTEDMRNLSGEVKHLCDICNGQYATKKILNIHKKIHTEQLTQLSCIDCEYKTFSRQCLYLHKRNNHVPKLNSIECKICLKLFKSKTLLNYHVKRVHQKVKPLKCKSCDTSFQFQCHLRIHTNSVHLGIKTRKKCEICKEHFADIYRHKKKVHCETNLTKAFNCNVCEKVYTNEVSLADHVRYTHRAARKQCELCNQTFSHVSSLIKHTKMKHKDKPDYKCLECDKNFASKDSLNMHVKYKHKEGSVLFCGKCDYRGRIPADLKKTYYWCS